MLFALMLLPGFSFAVICKTLDADGNVTYTDVPAAACPEVVKLPAASTYQPRPIEASAEEATETAAEPEPFDGYRSIAITQPEKDGTVRSNEGEMTVTVALEPALQTGHAIKLEIDGRAVEGGFDGLAIDLSGVERGTHTLRATVVDGTGKDLIASQTVSFTMRKAGLFDTAPPRPAPR